MVEEETRKFCLLIRDDIKVLGIICPHRKFLGVGDDFVFDGDWRGEVEDFNHNEDVSVFHRQFYWILWLRATKFDGDGGGVAIVDKFNLGGMGDGAFVVCWGWWNYNLTPYHKAPSFLELPSSPSNTTFSPHPHPIIAR